MQTNNVRFLIGSALIAGLLSFNLVNNATHDSHSVSVENNSITTPSSAAVTYAVDIKKSLITWKGKKYTGEHTGNVTLSGGSVLIDKSTLVGGTFTIDTRTITSTDVTDEGSNAKLVGHLKSDDFFGVEKFPEAKLAILSVKPAGGANYTVNGNLTIKGKTNPVTFPATVTVSGKQVTANAKITIDRSKYDIKFRSQSFFENLGDKVIYDEFELDVQLVAATQ